MYVIQYGLITKSSNYLSGEPSNSLFMLVKFWGKLAKKERKFICVIVAGDLKQIPRVLAAWFDLELPAFPFFRMDSFHWFKEWRQEGFIRLENQYFNCYSLCWNSSF